MKHAALQAHVFWHGKNFADERAVSSSVICENQVLLGILFQSSNLSRQDSLASAHSRRTEDIYLSSN